MRVKMRASESISVYAATEHTGAHAAQDIVVCIDLDRTVRASPLFRPKLVNIMVLIGRSQQLNGGRPACPRGGMDLSTAAEIVLAPYYTFLSVFFSLALYPQRSVYTVHAEAGDKFQVRPSGLGQVEGDSGAERADVIGVDQAAGERWADDDAGTQGSGSRGERAADECTAKDRGSAGPAREGEWRFGASRLRWGSRNTYV